MCVLGALLEGDCAKVVWSRIVAVLTVERKPQMEHDSRGDSPRGCVAEYGHASSDTLADEIRYKED